MANENTNPVDNDIQINPDSLHTHAAQVIPFPGRAKNARRVRTLLPADTPGYQTTTAIHSCEPPQSSRQHLSDANQHLSMSRSGEAFATAINLAIEAQWETLNDEWEELDPASRAVLSADKVAVMPGHRALHAQSSPHLRRSAIIHRILSSSRKAA